MSSPKSTMRQSSESDRSLFFGLLAGSTIYGVIGVFAMCYGIFLTIDKSSFVAMVVGTSLPYLSTVLVTLAGAFSIFIGLVGCCGSLARNRCLLGLFIVLVVLVYTMSMVGSSSAIVFRSWISDQIRVFMRNAIQTQYGTNSTVGEKVTQEWDTVQQKWYCCAAEDNSWGLYLQSKWFALQSGVFMADKPLVPISCCSIDQYGHYRNIDKCQTFLLGPPMRQSGEYNEALYYNGCYSKSTTVLYDVAGSVIGLGIMLGFLDLVLVGLSTWIILVHRQR